jgi:transketolase
MRLAALMEIPTIYVLTHDSIWSRRRRPTHQPIEQLASLRAMPHMIVMRPGDANEVVEAESDSATGSMNQLLWYH